jgi:hypothetical protein
VKITYDSIFSGELDFLLFTLIPNEKQVESEFLQTPAEPHSTPPLFKPRGSSHSIKTRGFAIYSSIGTSELYKFPLNFPQNFNCPML